MPNPPGVNIPQLPQLWPFGQSQGQPGSGNCSNVLQLSGFSWNFGSDNQGISGLFMLLHPFGCPPGNGPQTNPPGSGNTVNPSPDQQCTNNPPQGPGNNQPNCPPTQQNPMQEQTLRIIQMMVNMIQSLLAMLLQPQQQQPGGLPNQPSQTQTVPA